MIEKYRYTHSPSLSTIGILGNMLKKFTVGNFLSFHHHQTFTMSSANPLRVVRTPHSSLNQFSAIFGKNKENLLKAISYASQTIMRGTDIAQSSLYSPAQPSNIDTPSSFDFEIIVGENIYSIGFEIDTTHNMIVEQWLIDIAKGKKEILYYINTVTGNYTYKEDLFSEKEFTSIINNKETHSFLISDVIHKNIPLEQNDMRNAIFEPILNWFSRITIIDDLSSHISEETVMGPLIFNLYEISLIFGGKISPVLDSVVLELERISKNEPSENIILVHNNTLYMRFKPLDKPIWFSPILVEQNNEFNHLLFVLLSLEKHHTLMIHDIEKYLPTPLSQLFARTLFLILHLKEIQCIITTEETALLDLNLLKKNEIWFVSTGEFDASRLISYDCFFFEDDKDIALAYKNGEFATI